MADGRNSGSGRRESAGQTRRRLANEQRLVALGEAVDRRQNGGKPVRRRRGGRGRKWIIAGVALVVVLVALLGGGYLYANYRFNNITKISVANEVAQPISGAPFNILVIGSDSRVGLTGAVAAQTGATSGSVAGQRSDVVKIVHVDPQQNKIAVISIPRDTMVSLLANQSLYGNTNRINVNFGNGPGLLVQTIEANFGIPIHDTVVVSFAGMINVADAIGGVYLNFPYPSADPYSGLRIPHAGCQLIKGFEALAVTRSRHFYYDVHGNGRWPGDNASYSTLAADGWVYDGTSDFGRIARQDAFLRAMLNRVKGIYNPLTLNSLLSNIPQGITLDQKFSLNELIGLAVRFHSLNANSIATYTMPTVAGVNPIVGDVLYVDQPAAQQLLVNVFGSQLMSPTNPPPNASGATPPPPVVTTTTTTVAHTTTGKHHHGPTTTTTNPTIAVPSFDPVPCAP
jgi:LCP family protein required for cell wall assembly